MKLKYVLICVMLLSVSGCDGGGGDSGGSGGGTIDQPVTDITNPAIYPISSTASFRFHSVGDVFRLSNGSSWQIVGTSDCCHNTGNTTSAVTVYYPATTAPDPVGGVRSEYYLVGSGITPAFFVKPLPLQPLVSGTVGFRLNSVGDVIRVSDGTSWQIVGTSNCCSMAATVTSSVTVYSPAANAPDPVGGVRSDYYLVGSGITPAFFMKPLSLNPIASGTVDFRLNSVGDVIRVSDGTSWQIVGTSNCCSMAATVTSSVTVYSPAANAPDPVGGVRSDYYLVGSGITPAFYVVPI